MTVWLLTVLSKAMVKVKGVLKHSCGSRLVVHVVLIVPGSESISILSYTSYIPDGCQCCNHCLFPVLQNNKKL